MRGEKMAVALPLSPEQQIRVLRDLELIVQGEELDIPWRRVRILLDHQFAEIHHPVIAQGSNTSLNFTSAGLLHMGQQAEPCNSPG